MAQQNINIGSVANDGTGDSLRVGAIKINGNFTELYDLLASLPQVAFTGDYDDLFNKPVGGGGGEGAVDSVNGQTGVVVLTKSDVGLGAYPTDPGELQIAPVDLSDIYLELDSKADFTDIPTVPPFGTTGLSLAASETQTDALTILGFQQLDPVYRNGPIGLDEVGETRLWTWLEASREINQAFVFDGEGTEPEISGDFTLENYGAEVAGWVRTITGDVNLTNIEVQELAEGSDFKILILKQNGVGSHLLTVEPRNLAADPPISGFVFANELIMNSAANSYTAFLIGKVAGQNRIWNFPLEYVAP